MMNNAPTFSVQPRCSACWLIDELLLSAGCWLFLTLCDHLACASLLRADQMGRNVGGEPGWPHEFIGILSIGFAILQDQEGRQVFGMFDKVGSLETGHGSDEGACFLEFRSDLVDGNV